MPTLTLEQVKPRATEHVAGTNNWSEFLKKNLKIKKGNRLKKSVSVYPDPDTDS